MSEMTHGWEQHLHDMDICIASGHAAAAVRSWHRAHAAVVDQPGWEPIVRVAEAAERIGAIAGFARAADARARETYWIALFRAHREGSLAGVLQAAEGFARLGDRSMVDQCIRIAEGLTTRSDAEAQGAWDIAALAADLVRRYFQTPSGTPARCPS
jgi:hypothetical protein